MNGTSHVKTIILWEEERKRRAGIPNVSVVYEMPLDVRKMSTLRTSYRHQHAREVHHRTK
jgi:hypothetical protein